MVSCLYVASHVSDKAKGLVVSKSRRDAVVRRPTTQLHSSTVIYNLLDMASRTLTPELSILFEQIIHTTFRI